MYAVVFTQDLFTLSQNLSDTSYFYVTINKLRTSDKFVLCCVVLCCVVLCCVVLCCVVLCHEISCLKAHKSVHPQSLTLWEVRHIHWFIQ